MTSVPADWECVYAGSGLADMHEPALVLAALGLDYWLVAPGPGMPAGQPHQLLVPAGVAAYARQQLGEYLAERAAKAAPLPPPRLRVELRDLVGMWLVLIGGFLCQQRDVLGVDWMAAGGAQAGLLCGGQWWRAVTALTLHANGPHLFGNLLFGSLFGTLLRQELGRGMAWLAVVLAGSVANAASACLHPPEHTSVGASTAVFAAIGMTLVLQWRHHTGRMHRLGRAAPLVMAVIFLGFLGTAGEHTDVMAHAWGLVVGIAGGGLFNWAGVGRSREPGARPGLEGLALLVVLASWVLALQQAGG